MLAGGGGKKKKIPLVRMGGAVGIKQRFFSIFFHLYLHEIKRSPFSSILEKGSFSSWYWEFVWGNWERWCRSFCLIFMKSNGGLLSSAGIDIGVDFIIDHSAFSFDYDLAQGLCILTDQT